MRVQRQGRYRSLIKGSGYATRRFGPKVADSIPYRTESKIFGAGCYDYYKVSTVWLSVD